MILEEWTEDAVPTNHYAVIYNEVFNNMLIGIVQFGWEGGRMYYAHLMPGMLFSKPNFYSRSIDRVNKAIQEFKMERDFNFFIENVERF